MDHLKPSADDAELEFAVIIPCHNVERTLAAQLDALTAQTWTRPWGILVVDNNSTDGTRAIAEAYQSRGVRIVEAHEGRGVAYARNVGVRATQARAFSFCDGDDVAQPGWVSAIAEALVEADLVSGRLDTAALNPPWLATTRPTSRSGGLPTFGTLTFASGGNGGMTRALFERLGGYDESFAGLEDIEFSLRAHAVGASLAHVPDAVLSYRLRDDLASVWRQGFHYGRGRPELKRRARALGLPVPSSLETVKSWVWLLVHLPGLMHRSGRYRWTWVLANRIGVIQGSLDALHHWRRDIKIDTPKIEQG